MASLAATAPAGVTRSTDQPARWSALMVAIVQLAITLGATLGGLVFDAAGAAPEFVMSAGLLVLATLAAVAVARLDWRTGIA